MTQIVSSGVTSSGLTIDYTSPLYVASGGEVIDTVIDNDGMLSFDAGAVASQVTVSSGGEFLMTYAVQGSAALPSNDTVAGYFFGSRISATTVVSGVTLLSGADLDPQAYILVESGGVLTLSSGQFVGPTFEDQVSGVTVLAGGVFEGGAIIGGPGGGG